MASSKEIRGHIKSVENTRKITKAMEMVAASKMRRAQERMRASRPYSDIVRSIAAHMTEANPEYVHPFTLPREGAKRVGFVVVTTDKGLCGGLNTNILRISTNRMRAEEEAGNDIVTVVIGNKGLGFLNRIGAKILSHAVQLGDAPRLDRLIGPLKVLLDEYQAENLDAIYLCYNKFVNTMKQEPVVEQLLPLPTETLSTGNKRHSWEYIYEPDAPTVIDTLLVRYIEALIYQSVADNIASEQSARMVAMKSASDNAGNVIAELKLIYNKTRQAAITTELTEIVAGAAAV
ncbi:F0F1 ATP synthase subunit gamma [Oxalobacter vibrioformis]|uniref:ATP synthase gamma chain n=1 Tax=Oxalobacter vibrioformis TaxID=933080 RepID=A0A9E9LY01_9BURK|nr:F0F1 ATP synthase subunit gamma [Oxalobacter vibrioformis]WAW08963.1 F0F1 ATP synthase subunit gamma [Oxalobacter vibrioformis]